MKRIFNYGSLSSLRSHDIARVKRNFISNYIIERREKRGQSAQLVVNKGRKTFPIKRGLKARAELLSSCIFWMMRHVAPGRQIFLHRAFP